MDPLTTLAARWREEAEVLRRCGHDDTARLQEQHADELERAWREHQMEALTVTQAAAESGYSESHLYQLLGDGSLANMGRKGAPRIARQDLPRKPGQGSNTDSFAERILRAREGG